MNERSHQAFAAQIDKALTRNGDQAKLVESAHTRTWDNKVPSIKEVFVGALGEKRALGGWPIC